MDYSLLADVVAKFSPVLSGVLTGLCPVAGVATSVIGLIAKTFGADPKNVQDIVNKISADPDAALKLRQIELQHEETLAAIQKDAYIAEVDDRKSAREREEKIVATLGHTDYILNTIAILVVIGFFSLCVINFFVKPADDHLLMLLIGQVSSGFTLVLGYFFGASFSKK